MQRYSLTFKVEYDHTYESEEFWSDDEEPQDGSAEPCDYEGCSCNRFEAPLTVDEMDAFMLAEYCGRPRYYWYICSVLEYGNVKDATYECGGMIRCTIDCDLSAKKLARKFAEYREVFYDAGPDSESVVPTRHRYYYTVLTTFKKECSYMELGHICIDVGSICVSEDKNYI
jgi:hypothetical protein